MRFIAVVQSVLAALFGVQSEQKYQDDFNKPSALPYVVVGIVLVTLFVILLSVFVNQIAS
jgi:hypothetical protein